MKVEPATELESRDEVAREDGFRLEAVDLPALIEKGVPGTLWLLEPWLPEGAVAWLIGGASTGKSMLAQAWSSELTRAGFPAAYVSSENPLRVDVERFRRLKPDFDRLALFHGSGLDLGNREHLVELALQSRSQNACLTVLDTLTACWGGDESSNAEIAKLDREVLRVLGRLTGSTILVLHHVGHPQAFVPRKGVHAGRGASSIGDKADVVLNITSSVPGEFVLEVSKNRFLMGIPEPPTKFKIVDREDGGLGVEAVGLEVSARVDECTDAAVALIEGEGPLSTRKLKAGLVDHGFGGVTIQATLAYLQRETPSRVKSSWMKLTTDDGRARKAKAWTAC